jgi:toxin lethal factor
LSGAGKYVDKKILATTIVHEFGHLISFEQQKADSEFWTKWEKAAKQDGLGASRYSFTNHDEDFAETFVLYFSGGNTAGDVRAKYANRFAILDKVISK